MIQTAIYTDEDQSSIKVTYEDGQELFVPVADGNRHYAELQAWVAEGNTIDDYVKPPQADEPKLTPIEKIEQATGLTIDEIKQAIGV